MNLGMNLPAQHIAFSIVAGALVFATVRALDRRGSLPSRNGNRNGRNGPRVHTRTSLSGPILPVCTGQSFLAALFRNDDSVAGHVRKGGGHRLEGVVVEELPNCTFVVSRVDASSGQTDGSSCRWRSHPLPLENSATWHGKSLTGPYLLFSVIAMIFSPYLLLSSRNFR